MMAEEAAADGKPFFLWYPTTIPHAELIVPEDSIITSFRGRYPEHPYKGVDSGPAFRHGGYVSQEYPHATFAAMVTRLDAYVGQIVEKLRELGGRQAVRQGPWKLVHMNVCRDDAFYELYNLDEDPGETTDLADRYPDKVVELQAILREAHVPNPDFPLLKEEWEN